MMEHMVRELFDIVKEQQAPRAVTQDEYNVWCAGFIFDGMRSLRYGQSFCNHFGITDNILYYDTNTENADRYIRKTYVK
jgi:hypothetical protein